MHRIAIVDDDEEMAKATIEFLEDFSDDMQFRTYFSFYDLPNAATQFDLVICDPSTASGGRFNADYGPLRNYVENHPGVPIILRALVCEIEIREDIRQVIADNPEKPLLYAVDFSGDGSALLKLVAKLLGVEDDGRRCVVEEVP